MKRFHTAAAVFGLAALAIGPSFAALGPYGGEDHTTKILAYNGPQTCLGCHTVSKMGSNLAEDLINSAHFQFRTSNPSIMMPGGGSHGMLDRACGVPGTTLMAGNYATTASSPVGAGTLDDGCGKCHIAYRPPSAYAMMGIDPTPDLDCLRCHAAVYAEEWDDAATIAKYGTNPQPHVRKVIDLPDLTGKTWSQDRSLKTAQSVGIKPVAKSCLRCHEHGYTGYKRATPFEVGTDVHATAGVERIECHAMQKHKIARGNYVTDHMASDLPGTPVSCLTTCHGTGANGAPAPHATSVYKDLLNTKHSVDVSCEVCHIPTMDVPSNVHRRSWAPYTMDPNTNAWLATPPTTGGAYPGFWDAYSEYFPTGSTPAFRWFNGGASMLAQPFGGYSDRASANGGSKLFAFKPFVSGMLFDGAWLCSPSPDDPIAGTRAFSMKDFYEKNWSAFLNFGFIDSQWPTPLSYWQAYPQMAQVLNKMPMMLQFDRGIYLSQAGTVVGTPPVGPQTAVNYPGIAKAIDSGMGKMALDMGYCAQGTPQEACGKNMWSGQFFGMWVPDNMDPTSPFFTEVTSMITMSHAIKQPTFEAEPCYNCHLTPQQYAGRAAATGKRADFAKLGFPDTDKNTRVDPKYDNTNAISGVVLGPYKNTLTYSATTKAPITQKLTASATIYNFSTNKAIGNVTVYAKLTGPAGDLNLPKLFSAVTSSSGVVTFTYSQSALAKGNYVFTIYQYGYSGKTFPEYSVSKYTKP